MSKKHTAEPGENTVKEQAVSPEKEACKKACDTAGNPSPATGDKTAGKAEKAHKPDELELLKQCLAGALADGKKLNDEKEALKKLLEEKEELLTKLNDRLARVVEEYDNYRRRSAGDKQNAYNDAVAKAVAALLPAMDNLERALPFAEANPESFRQGVEMTLKQLAGGFEKLGVEEIATEAGSAFNPDIHNAVMHVEDDSLSENVVCEVFQKGFKVGDKVIRHAVVKVAN